MVKIKFFSLVFEGGAFSVMMHALKAYRKNDTAIISELMRNNEQSISKLQKDISSLSGDQLFELIIEDQNNLKANVVYPAAAGALTAGLLASKWLSKK